MPNTEKLIEEVFSQLPVPFVRDFLRAQKDSVKGVRIGTTLPEVRANLRDALNAQLISEEDVREWLKRIEGYGRQHLYLYRVPKRSLLHQHLLSAAALKAFLRRRKLFDEPSDGNPARHRLADVVVDDEFARLIWHSQSTAEERRSDLDETRVLDEGDFLFKAYRLTPKRSTCQLLIRKTDGVVLHSLDLPLEDEHNDVRGQIFQVSDIVLAPLKQSIVPVAPMVSTLDESALAKYGPRAKRGLSMSVEPTQARYSADGARIDFSTSRSSIGYAASSAVRRARRALQVEKVVGEAGKFRLTFVDAKETPHTMVVSFHATDNRVYLFSRMKEEEVLSLVDQLVALVP